jgi:hypothetical protein
MRYRRSLVLVAGCALMAAFSLSSCRVQSPAADVATGQMMLELTDAINQMRQDNALLQAQVDSLRDAVARQDTVIAKIATAAGVAVPVR